MTALKILNASLFALFATLTLVLAVVWLMYLVNLDTAPRLKPQMPTLTAFFGVFAVLTTASGVALLGLLRAHPWRWLAQLGFAITLVPCSLLLYRLVS
jgi:hypothetical protein